MSTWKNEEAVTNPGDAGYQGMTEDIYATVDFAVNRSRGDGGGAINVLLNAAATIILEGSDSASVHSNLEQALRCLRECVQMNVARASGGGTA